MDATQDLSTEAQVEPEMIDESDFNVTPELLASCHESAIAFLGSLSKKSSDSALTDILSSYVTDKKNAKKKDRRLCHDIASAQERLSSAEVEKQKLLERFAELSCHEANLYGTLQSHMQVTSESMTKYQTMQKDMNKKELERRGLLQKAQIMSDKIGAVTETLKDLQLTKARLMDEKSPLVNSNWPQALQDTKQKLALTTDKLQCFKQSLVEVRHILKDSLNANKRHEMDERQLRNDIEGAQLKINQSVTDINHLKLKIEAKKIDEQRQIGAVQEKLEKVQALCDAQSHDLQAKLQVPLLQGRAELAAIVQKNRCLEELFKAQCEKQKQIDRELVKTRSAIWQDKEERKQTLLKAIAGQKMVLLQKKATLNQLNTRMKQIHARKTATQRRKSLEAAAANNSKIEFKKPAVPKPVMTGHSKLERRRKSTNELFSQLRSPRKSRALAPPRSPSQPPSEIPSPAPSIVSIPRINGNQPSRTMDDCTSILTMSSIEAFESLERRLDRQLQQIEDQSVCSGSKMEFSI